MPSDEFSLRIPAARSTGGRDRRIAHSGPRYFLRGAQIAEALKDAREILGEREAVVARELTKLHEEILRGRLSELASQFGDTEHEPRGEIVLMIDRHPIESADDKNKPGPSISTLVAGFEAEGIEPRAALKKAAKLLGISRDEAYRHLIGERSLEK